LLVGSVRVINLVDI